MNENDSAYRLRARVCTFGTDIFLIDEAERFAGEWFPYDRIIHDISEERYVRSPFRVDELGTVGSELNRFSG